LIQGNDWEADKENQPVNMPSNVKLSRNELKRLDLGRIQYHKTYVDQTNNKLVNEICLEGREMQVEVVNTAREYWEMPLKPRNKTNEKSSNLFKSDERTGASDYENNIFECASPDMFAEKRNSDYSDIPIPQEIHASPNTKNIILQQAKKMQELQRQIFELQRSRGIESRVNPIDNNNIYGQSWGRTSSSTLSYKFNPLNTPKDWSFTPSSSSLSTKSQNGIKNPWEFKSNQNRSKNSSEKPPSYPLTISREKAFKYTLSSSKEDNSSNLKRLNLVKSPSDVKFKGGNTLTKQLTHSRESFESK
jgi:hypothetical protein